MERQHTADRPQEHVWETPLAEEIRVSAEACAYMGAWQDEDWT
jgi:hypothetical protein